MHDCDSLVEELLEKDCWVLDYLPRQVPADAPGQFFKVETYLLNHYEEYGLRARFTAVVLKLMCYHRVSVHWGQWVDAPSPDLVTEAIKTILDNHSGWLNILLPEENALQIRAFLADHPEYELMPLPNTFPEELRKLQTPDGLQLLGCRDGVEGFFIARMKRVK